VRDLARGLNELGPRGWRGVRFLNAGDELAEQRLRDLEGHIASWVSPRIQISRMPGPGDLSTAGNVVAAAKALQPDIRSWSRCQGRRICATCGFAWAHKSVYTPHGGVLHYSWSSAQGFAFLSAEKLLLRKTSGLVFVCDYERQAFEDKVGLGQVANVVGSQWSVGRGVSTGRAEPDCNGHPLCR
jgi:hypothetical protein